MQDQATLQEKLENKTFDIKTTTTHSTGIKHAEKSIPFTALKQRFTRSTTSHDLAPKMGRSSTVGTSMVPTTFLDHFLALSDPQCLNSTRGCLFTHEGDQKGQVDLLASLPRETAQFALIEKDLSYIGVDEHCGVFLSRPDKEGVLEWGSGFLCGDRHRFFKLSGNSVLFASGPRELTFVKDVEFKPLLEQNSTICDVEFEKGVLMDYFIISATELLAISTAGEVAVYGHGGDQRSREMLKLDGGKVLVQGATVSADSRYVIIYGYNMATCIPRMYLLEISEDLDIENKSIFDVPGDFGDKPDIYKGIGAINAGISLEGHPIIAVGFRKGDYNKEERQWSGRVSYFGINDSGELESIG